jgi:hypothetical protein
MTEISIDDRNRISRSWRALVFVALSMPYLVAIGCQRDSTSAKFAAVSRAAKALEAGISVGVTNPKFHDLIQNLYTEIYVARDQVATDREKALLKQYADAAEVYLDSLRLWDKEGKEGITICDWVNVPKGGTIVECPKAGPDDLSSIAQKYSLPVTMHELKLVHYVYGTVPASSVQDVWKIGSQKLAACNAALNAGRQ